MSPSIKDVARIAGVSIATVSRYLGDPDSIREKNRALVEAAIKETGYAPNSLAQNFRRGRTSLIIVVMPNVGDPFFTGVMRGISQIAEEEGYSLLIRETEMNTLSWDQYSEMVFSKQADGVILLASFCPFTPVMKRPGREGQVPIVLGCENVTPELGEFPAVRIDNVAAAQEATRFLIHQGHERIAFVAGMENSTLTADREQGYCMAMKEAGLPVKRGWITSGALSLDGARKATRKLLNHQQTPTAIFCATDEMAIGCIHEIKSAGLSVPKDVSVMGFDNIRYAEIVDPPLTTIAQPAEEIGERTMRRLCRAIHGRDMGTKPEIVPHQLVVRRSTSSPENSSLLAKQ